MKAEELTRYDGLGLAELVRRREVSATELLDASIARVEALNPEINAVVTRLYDQARAAIAAGLPAGPFTGVPYLLKDLGAHYAGAVTSYGSALFNSSGSPAMSVPLGVQFAATYGGEATLLRLAGQLEAADQADGRGLWGASKAAIALTGGATSEWPTRGREPPPRAPPHLPAPRRAGAIRTARSASRCPPSP